MRFDLVAEEEVRHPWDAYTPGPFMLLLSRRDSYCPPSSCRVMMLCNVYY